MASPASAGRQLLKLTNLKLYGREKEVALLQEVYQRVAGSGNDDDDSSAEVVLVHGAAGSGKTAVVEELQKTIAGSSSNAYFVSGKFDQQENTKPFSALVDALTLLCDNLICSDRREEYKKKILEALQDEWKTLADAIPNLRDLLDKQPDPLFEGHSSASFRPDNAVIRLKTLFREFLRAVSSPGNPVVLFLDDLQFSDAASIDLIDSIMIDQELKHFLIIGSYRDEEVTDSIRKILKKGEGSFVSVFVASLTLASISELLADVMKMKCEETEPLAQVVLQKTRGNAFFVLQFVRLARDKGLLYFSFQTFKWQWDIEKIESEMNVSNNVVDLVIERLQRLPEETQVVLNMASCLGAEFESSLLATLIKHKNEEWDERGGALTNTDSLVPYELAEPSEEVVVEDMLRLVQEQELVIAAEVSGRYRFSHDRIQQASYLLIPEGPEKRSTELRIGVQLLRLFYSTYSSRRWMIFVAVNLLNRSSALFGAVADNERIELARLNLDTAKKAGRISAYLRAAGYLSKAIEILDETDNKWNDYYHLTLEIYTLAAEMEYTGGHCKKAETMATEIIKNNAVHESDKLPVYKTLVLAEGGQGKLQLALNTGIDAMARLGVHMSKKPSLVRVLLDLRKTQKLVEGMSDDQLLSLPPMVDERKQKALGFLRPIILYAWLLGAGNVSAVLYLKHLRLTLRYGDSHMTPAAYSSYGLLMANMGNEAEAFRFGGLAVRLLEAQANVSSKSFVLDVVHGFERHWRRPLHLSAEPLLEGHRVGMIQSGDIEFASYCLSTYCFLYFECGLPLGPFISNAKKFAQIQIEYEQKTSLLFTVIVWQAALNLMGRSENAFIFTGEAMDQEEMLRGLRESSNKAGKFTLTALRLEVTYIMGDIDLAYQLARELWALNVTTFKGHFHYNAAIFFSGLAEFAYARKAGKAKCRREAMRHTKVIAAWEKRGAVNQHPMRLLLEAEAATFGAGDCDAVRKLFDGAISAAMRSGFTNYAAIACERAAEFMSASSDSFWSEIYISKARDCYFLWGAGAKVCQLEGTYKLPEESRRTETSWSSRAEKRFSVADIRSSGISDLGKNIGTEVFELSASLTD